MKINVGDYVRSESGLIGKIIGFKGDMVETDNKRLITYKSNHNECKIKERPIDLIEVGDYVNGYLIDYIDSERRYLRSERPYREDSTMYKDLIEKGRNYNQCLHFLAEDIKSIVTHEQMEAMEYKIEN